MICQFMLCYDGDWRGIEGVEELHAVEDITQLILNHGENISNYYMIFYNDSDKEQFVYKWLHSDLYTSGHKTTLKGPPSKRITSVIDTWIEP
jgi:hypothetical protein